MKVNGQYLKKYSGFTYDDLTERIAKEWKDVYSDCRIVSISMQKDVALVHALVVFEEVKKEKALNFPLCKSCDKPYWPEDPSGCCDMCRPWKREEK